jgi:hypothetical protein
MSKLIKLSIDLTAIPKGKIKDHTNGKKYVSIDCWVNDEVDRFGKNVSLNISQSLEERNAKSPKVFCGGGETKFGFEKNEQSQKMDRSNNSKDDTDDIPW